LSRPHGDVRVAMRRAAYELSAECGAASWREMAVRAGVGFKMARRTAENMARGPRPDLVAVGFDKPAGTKVWVRMYEPAQQLQEMPASAPPLEMVLRSWVAI
jgi:hypothetical protein